MCPQERHPLGNAAPVTGLREWNDLLAVMTRLAARRGLGTAAPDLAPTPYCCRGLDGSRASLDSASLPAPGGEASGPTPRDRGKSGTKRHLVVERNGLPLDVIGSAANGNECQRREATLDAVPPIRGRCGRPRKRQKSLHADKRGGRRQVPPGVPPPRHHTASGAQGHRVQPTPGPLSLGGRAHAGLVEPLPTSEGAL